MTGWMDGGLIGCFSFVVRVMPRPFSVWEEFQFKPHLGRPPSNSMVSSSAKLFQRLVRNGFDDDGLVGWMHGWMDGWLDDWLVGWMTERMVCILEGWLVR